MVIPDYGMLGDIIMNNVFSKIEGGREIIEGRYVNAVSLIYRVDRHRGLGDYPHSGIGVAKYPGQVRIWTVS